MEHCMAIAELMTAHASMLPCAATSEANAFCTSEPKPLCPSKINMGAQYHYLMLKQVKNFNFGSMGQETESCYGTARGDPG